MFTPSPVMNRRIAMTALLGAAVVAPQLTFAQSRGDLLMTALMGGEFALQTSQLALRRSRNARVRQFAQLESNEQIAYAAAMGFRPGSADLNPDQQAMLQQLSSVSGATFGRLYVRGQIAGHQELLALNQTFAQGASDPLRRAVATVAVPAIQTHLTMLSSMRTG